MQPFLIALGNLPYIRRIRPFVVTPAMGSSWEVSISPAATTWEDQVFPSSLERNIAIEFGGGSECETPALQKTRMSPLKALTAVVS